MEKVYVPLAGYCAATCLNTSVSPNLNADFDGDGQITVADLVLMGRAIGEVC